MSPPDYSYDSKPDLAPAYVQYDDYRRQDWLNIIGGILLVVISWSIVLGPPLARAWVGGDWRCAVISCSVRVAP